MQKIFKKLGIYSCLVGNLFESYFFFFPDFFKLIHKSIHVNILPQFFEIVLEKPICINHKTC